ncbi:hypothetical protein CDIK_0657 [Cucumispora dikerogammari]|nr:hypothetical protein CDIK_0657 [Cucumispora dikerogammari]
MLRSSLFSYTEDPKFIYKTLKDYFIMDYEEKRISYNVAEHLITPKIEEESPFDSKFYINPRSKIRKFLSNFHSKSSKLIIKERKVLKNEMVALEFYGPDLSKDRKTNVINVHYLKTDPIIRFIGDKNGFYISDLEDMAVLPDKTVELRIWRFEINEVVLEISKTEYSNAFLIQIYLERDVDLKNIKDGIHLMERDLENVVEAIKILDFQKLPSYMF